MKGVLQSPYGLLLRKQEFSVYFLAQLVGTACDGLFGALVVFSAISHQAAATEIGFLTFCNVFPRVVIRPVAGVFADRWDKKNILLLAETGKAIVVVALAFFLHLGRDGTATLAVASLLISSLFSISSPAGRAYVGDVVEAQDAQPANGLLQSSFWPAYFIGAGIQSVLLAYLGIQAAFYVVGCALTVSGTLLTLLPATGRVPQGKTWSFASDLLNGYRSLAADKLLHDRVITYAIYTFFWRGVLQVCIPVALRDKFPSHADVYGVLMLTNGILEMLITLWIGRRLSSNPLRLAHLSEGILGIVFVLLAVTYVVSAPIATLFGIVALVSWSAACTDVPVLTVIQRQVSRENQGKVMSLWFSVGSLGGALGTLSVGVAMPYVRTDLAMCAVGATLLTFCVWSQVKIARFSAQDPA
ncbi:DHA3 family macrolide efflux protein-like MFS transporter [Paraburkholderia sp. WC7.3g]|uniref:MFS transporter n=1 Tax=Paraburkholderia sp. WC7.3g TaxID=2991070 RepID=UPI003D252D5F